MPNAFVHVELATSDVAKAKSFYSQLFQWQLEDMPDGSYTMIRVGEGTGGGIMKNPMRGAPSAWIAYVHVEDINAATQKANSLGAKILKDVTDVRGYGHFSVLMDPTGAVLAMFQPAPRT
jgi:predicted enzyme related to lactoylglutathione lyase